MSLHLRPGFSMSERLTTNFTLGEMCVTSKALPNVPGRAEKAALLALCEHILQPLRDNLDLPIKVTSGYRSEAVNAAVGGSSSSQHKLGQAADIRVAGMTPKQVCEAIIALDLPFDQLIEEHNSWVHVSYGPKDRREVLRARVIKGKTVYLPGLE